MGQFFSWKKGQTVGVSEGGLSKGHNFSVFFPAPFPKSLVNCTYIYVILSYMSQFWHLTLIMTQYWKS